jgi:hypothetical protein
MRTIKNKSIKWWLGMSLCVLLFAVIATFAYIKMSFLMKGVQIEATIDHDSSSSLVKVKGMASNAVYLSLNGREIFIDKDGSFLEIISLLPGLGVINLEAKDKFGNTANKKFEVMYKENTGAIAFNEK